MCSIFTMCMILYVGGQRHHRRKHKDKHRSKHKKHQGGRKWKPIPLSTEYRQQFKMWPLNVRTYVRTYVVCVCVCEFTCVYMHVCVCVCTMFMIT